MRHIRIGDVSHFKYHFMCLYFGLFRLRIVENDGYPFFYSTMSEFDIFCVLLIALFVFLSHTFMV